MIKCLILPAVALSASAASAAGSTYMCKVGGRTYPVTVTLPNEENGSMEGGTITWRGKVFRDVRLGDGCRYNFLATGDDGVRAELCTATQGYAELTIGRKRFSCQMAR